VRLNKDSTAYFTGNHSSNLSNFGKMDKRGGGKGCDYCLWSSYWGL